MGMSKLNIWISTMDDPCGVDDKHQWFITIYDCDGYVLSWCKKRYIVLPAKCGHLEVEVPPGVYYIKAVWGYSIAGGAYYGNHFTDAAIVQACCDQTVCVKLFNPSVHRCGPIIIRAMKDLVMQKFTKVELAKKLEEQIKTILADIPKPKKGFELDYLDEIDELIKRQEKK